MIGALGVPVFLVVSGYFFNYNEKDSVFWWKKLKQIVIPWILYGLFTYFVKTVLSGADGLLGLAKWIFGNGTWLYFVPLILFCFFVFRINDSHIFHGILFAVFLMFNVLIILNVLQGNSVITTYQMMFNMTGYFQLGIYWRKYKNQVNEILHQRMFIVISIIMWMCAAIIHYCFSNGWTYFIFRTLALLPIYYLSIFLSKSNFLMAVGKNTYLIYFLHMQIGNGVAIKVFENIGFEIPEYTMLILKPLFILLLMYAIIKFGTFTFKKMKLEKVMWLVALKQ